MSHRIALALSALFLAAGGGAALAAGAYPYSGAYASQTTDTSPADAALSCAWSFFRQNSDGSFTGYILDKAAWNKDQTVRYLTYATGTCTVTSGKLEACTMATSADADEIGKTYYDVIKAIGPDAIDTASFDRSEDAAAYALGGIGTPSVELRFTACKGFDGPAFEARLSDTLTTLSLDERGPLQSPEFTDANRADMAAILAKIATQK